MEVDVKTDPSWGLLQFNRCSASYPGRRLFKSDVNNTNFISLTLKTASVHRNLGSDFCMDEETLAEVLLSPVQFAELLTNMNVGCGVPCTIRYYNKQKIEFKEETPKLEILVQEADQRVDGAIEGVVSAYEKIKGLMENKKIPKERAMEILRDLLPMISTHREHGSTFYKKQAREELAAMVNEAKSQIGEYVDHKIYQAGLEKLLSNYQPPTLIEVDTDDNT